jgi:hypothetical protein
MITRRRAVKPYVCTYGCGSWIKSGSVYLRHAIPLREKGRRGIAESLRECGTCATKAGRAGLLEKK